MLNALTNGVIAQTLQMLDETLIELRSLGQVYAAALRKDWLTRRAVERDLQIPVEIVLDVCQRLISLAGQSPAATGADAVARCMQMGALTDDDAYRQMVRFRNFIVHRYERIDVEILATVVNRQLADLTVPKRDPGLCRSKLRRAQSQSIGSVCC